MYVQILTVLHVFRFVSVNDLLEPVEDGKDSQVGRRITQELHYLYQFLPLPLIQFIVGCFGRF